MFYLIKLEGKRVGSSLFGDLWLILYVDEAFITIVVVRSIYRLFYTPQFTSGNQLVAEILVRTERIGLLEFQ